MIYTVGAQVGDLKLTSALRHTRIEELDDRQRVHSMLAKLQVE